MMPIECQSPHPQCGSIHSPPFLPPTGNYMSAPFEKMHNLHYQPPPRLNQLPKHDLPPWIRRMSVQHDPYYVGYGMPSIYNACSMYEINNFYHEVDRKNYQAHMEMMMTQDTSKGKRPASPQRAAQKIIFREQQKQCKMQAMDDDSLESLKKEDDDEERSGMEGEDSSKRKRPFHHISKNRQRNQTKNIPKNYGKAMITFILERSDWIKMRLGSHIHNQLIAELKQRKSRINSIIHLKDLWTNSKYSTEFRILSNLFLRKYSFSYIFNSRVSNFGTHIKYKYKLSDAVRRPAHFKSIKEY